MREWHPVRFCLIVLAPVLLSAVWHTSSTARNIQSGPAAVPLKARPFPLGEVRLLDIEYPIPEALTLGKARIVVRFQPQDQAATAQVFEVRVVARTK